MKGNEQGVIDNTAFTVRGASGGWLGISVGFAGDINHDDYSDVIIGSTEWDTPGRAYIYYGSETTPKANDDYSITHEDESITINVAKNDYDLDGNLDISSTDLITAPSNGEIQNNLDSRASRMGSFVSYALSKKAPSSASLSIWSVTSRSISCYGSGSCAHCTHGKDSPFEVIAPWAWVMRI